MTLIVFLVATRAVTRRRGLLEVRQVCSHISHPQSDLTLICCHGFNPLSPVVHMYVTSEVHSTGLWHIHICDIDPWELLLYTYFTHISDMLLDICKASGTEGVKGYRCLS